MREHNRICSALLERHKTWDDERLFQTARLINIVILIKLVVQDYINHIAGDKLFAFDPAFAEKEEWYRLPWVSLEFDLLYRWHGLVPDHITVDGRQYDDTRYMGDNALLEELGVAKVVDAASRQRAGQISLGNVPAFLLGAEYETIKMGRDFRLRPYNEYRKQFGLDVLTSFDELTDDTELRDKLQFMYKDIDNVSSSSVCSRKSTWNGGSTVTCCMPWSPTTPLPRSIRTRYFLRTSIRLALYRIWSQTDR